MRGVGYRFGGSPASRYNRVRVFGTIDEDCMTVDLSAPPALDGARANPPPAGTPAAIYHARYTRFAGERDRYTQQWNRIANIRLGAFVAAALCFAGAIWQNWPLLGGLGAGLLVVFAVLVRYHRQLGRLRARYSELTNINDEAGKRLARDWAALPLRHTSRAASGHPYAGDLDLFGRASVFHLLESVSTSMGEATLRDWLLAPAPPATVTQRQTAVAELTPLIDLRDELALRGRLMGAERPDPAPFLAWAEAAPWLRPRSALLWAGRLSVLLLWLSLGAYVLGLVPYPLWLIFLVINEGLIITVGRRVHYTLNQITAEAGVFRHYADLFQLLADTPFQAPALRRLQDALRVDGQTAHDHMRRLQSLMNWRFPPSSMLHGLFQVLFLWDAQVLVALEGWQARVGRHAGPWLAALGEAEALAALAGLAHANPTWVLPTFDPAAPTLEARDLGHPLLPAQGRVVNDVTVGPPGTFLLVTGSNMSGKSTLLRALGVNIVLAGAGGPVCATQFRLPPVALWTSMRITDSLEQGVSYYMAELQRLKVIVDAARADQGPDAPRLFYLLDEILQGTNTAERQIAARRIILYLVHCGALGAVSTHDLTLTDSPEMATVARTIHFTETFTSGPEGPAMTFDYKIRPGLATSTNALRLMEIVGLDLSDGRPPPRARDAGRPVAPGNPSR
jgi:hypothetical protein